MKYCRPPTVSFELGIKLVLQASSSDNRLIQLLSRLEHADQRAVLVYPTAHGSKSQASCWNNICKNIPSVQAMHRAVPTISTDRSSAGYLQLQHFSNKFARN